jgi:hypothetical protein
MSERTFVLCAVPRVRSLHQSEAGTFLVAHNKNKNITTYCLYASACVRTYSRVNQFQRFAELSIAASPPFSSIKPFFFLSFFLSFFFLSFLA